MILKSSLFELNLYPFDYSHLSFIRFCHWMLLYICFFKLHCLFYAYGFYKYVLEFRCVLVSLSFFFFTLLDISESQSSWGRWKCTEKDPTYNGVIKGPQILFSLRALSWFYAATKIKILVLKLLSWLFFEFFYFY